MLPRSLDPARIAETLPAFRHWFRYPLHPEDFRPLHERKKLRGYYASKPLYGKLDAHGRVDRSAGFNGQIMAVFVPSPAHSWKNARLVQAQAPAGGMRRKDGQRNWPVIRAAAEKAILATLA